MLQIISAFDYLRVETIVKLTVSVVVPVNDAETILNCHISMCLLKKCLNSLHTINGG